MKYHRACHDSCTVYSCICRSMARGGDVTLACLQPSPCYLLLTEWELLGQCFSRGVVTVQPQFASFFVFSMHESVICPWDLDQHDARQSHLWSKLPLSRQPGSCPHPRELLPAHKPAASSRKMEENGDTKSARSKEEGAQRRKGEGADAIHVHLPAPLRRAVMSPHGTCCIPSAHRGA